MTKTLNIFFYSYVCVNTYVSGYVDKQWTNTQISIAEKCVCRSLCTTWAQETMLMALVLVMSKASCIEYTIPLFRNKLDKPDSPALQLFAKKIFSFFCDFMRVPDFLESSRLLNFFNEWLQYHRSGLIHSRSLPVRDIQASVSACILYCYRYFWCLL